MLSLTPLSPPSSLTADSMTRAMAKENQIKVFQDTVIYRLEDELKSEMERQMPSEKTVVKEVP